MLAVFTPFLDVYYMDITQYITLCPPPNFPQRYDFKGLTPNDYMDMDLSPIFGLNSRFWGGFGRNSCASALRLLTFAQQLGLSKSTGLRLLGYD